ncbi:DUF2231 domain-containing protein [Tautonia plasticadhaerens]|uniref:Plastocyanin n=1 Tax=Tautonia plasticadhaerens TaxID=2527974 RepID=A0A518GUP1_9BACT|nr:plastocyanin/azurin family copper-binding protein [Tautonia plasticadhaerens]QDV32306.1 Plastocyanin precursor [Tautonia plasticadhaerens]
MPRRPILSAAATLVAAWATTAAAQGPAATVEMTGENTFEPRGVVIEAGQSVRWTNPSSVVHTVTADPDEADDPGNVSLPEGAEPFDSGDVEPGGSYSRTFDVPGTYQYVCLPHESIGMIGTVEVTDPGAGEASEGSSGSGPSGPDPGSGSGSGGTGSKGFAANLVTWLGKLHPPSVSFPIALVLSALLAEVLWSATGRPLFDHSARFCVWVGAIGAVVSVTLGWCFAGLAWSDGDRVMTTHRWVGTSAGLLAPVVLVLAEASRRPGGRSIRPWYLGLLVVAAVLVGLNGHFGGLMAYGEDYYAWPGSG